MRGRYSDIEVYDRLPPWLREMIRNSEYPISAIRVQSILMQYGGSEEEQKFAARAIISNTELGMRRSIQFTKVIR